MQMNVSYAPGSERSGQARPRRAMDEENDVSMFSSNRGVRLPLSLRAIVCGEHSGVLPKCAYTVTVLIPLRCQCS